LAPKIQLVITDLDNTLYDWVGSFVPSFYGMVRVASQLLSASEDTLLDELRSVHQHHGSSEHPFAVRETPTVKRRFPANSRAELRAILNAAFQEFNKLRKDTLHLYEGVEETLRTLGNANIPIVAYTDARVQNSLFRMWQLGLVPLISGLYAPGHLVDLEPTGPSPEYLGSISREYVRFLGPKDRKPNPSTLLDICKSFSVEPAESLYVGDSLVRDVYMAQRAGLHNAWARYGSQVDRTYWQRLVRVTHWAPDDVAREEQVRSEAGHVTPESTIDSFSALLELYRFGISMKTRA
jgi:FMN phosphatase YigB (HAD superfamily)